MKTKISEFFNKTYQGIKKAQRNADEGTDAKADAGK